MFEKYKGMKRVDIVLDVSREFPDLGVTELARVLRERGVFGMSRGNVSAVRIWLAKNRGVVFPRPMRKHREKNEEEINPTATDWKEYQAHEKNITQMISTFSRTLPSQLREEFSESATLIAIKAIIEYNHERGLTLNNYIYSRLNFWKLRVLTRNSSRSTGIPIYKIELVIKMHKIAETLMHTGLSENDAIIEAAKIVNEQYHKRTPRTRLTAEEILRNHEALKAEQYRRPSTEHRVDREQTNRARRGKR